jgi:hypothetical protein
MSLRTVDAYVDSLRDGRTVYFRGRRVDDVTTHPVISVAVRHAAIDYRLAEDPRHRALCVIGEGGDEYSRYYQVPRSTDDLLKRSELIELATAEGGTLVVLIKEIGTDAPPEVDPHAKSSSRPSITCSSKTAALEGSFRLRRRSRPFARSSSIQTNTFGMKPNRSNVFKSGRVRSSSSSNP